MGRTGTSKGDTKAYCESPRCKTPSSAVKYDRLLKKHLCNMCWVNTPMPKPPGR